MNLVKNSLYRYYRPQNFNDFVGQKNIVTILKNQIKNGSFNHALLFAGPRGCGKTSLARIFAKAINCEANNKQNNDQNEEIPCNHCSHCLQVQENKAFNIIELDGASNNGVEEIRNLIENSRLGALGAPYKIFIIDEVHMLSKAAFNALLKTLEEPPKHVIFILATTEMNKIPMTINSRCQIFNFQKIKKKEMKDRLAFIANEEKIHLEDLAINEIFYLSEGSLRDALNVLQQLIATEEKNIDLALVQNYFQIPTQQEKIKVLDNLLKNQAQELIDYFESINSQGLNLNLFILGLLDLVKEIIEFKITNNPQFLKQISFEEVQRLQGDVNRYFLIGDALSEAFQKNDNSHGEYSYVLIDLLKVINPKSNLETLDSKITNNPAKPINNSGLTFSEFLSFRENLLSKPRKISSRLISNNQIFNVLLGSSKVLRDEIDQKIKAIFAKNANDILINEKLAKTFVTWYSGSIVAVSDCEILIRFDNEEELIFFQETIEDSQWIKILQDNFNHQFVVYGVDRKRWELIKQEFILKKNNNKLNYHAHVSWDEIYGSIVNEDLKKQEFNNLANTLFGDLVELEIENK